MSQEAKLKIIVLGPVGSGKTSISNFLSDSTENVNGENRPTKGVRIVEFLAEGLKAKNRKPYKGEVELWDCSGDAKYESCWPAILQKTDGIVFIYNKNSSKQKRDLEILYKYFVDEGQVDENNCLLLFSGRENEKPTSPLPQLTQQTVSIEENGAELRKTFNSFLSAILTRNELVN